MDIIHQDAFYVRFWYIANSYGLLKVRCERGIVIRTLEITL